MNAIVWLKYLNCLLFLSLAKLPFCSYPSVLTLFTSWKALILLLSIESMFIHIRHG